MSNGITVQNIYKYTNNEILMSICPVNHAIYNISNTSHTNHQLYDLSHPWAVTPSPPLVG